MDRPQWRFLSVDELINIVQRAMHSRRGRLILAIGAAAMTAAVVLAQGAFGAKANPPAAAPSSDVTVSVPIETAPKIVLADPGPSPVGSTAASTSAARTTTTVASSTSTTPGTFPPGTFPPGTFPVVTVAPATFPPATAPPHTSEPPDTGVVVPYGPTTIGH
jgi:hypothetical protein